MKKVKLSLFAILTGVLLACVPINTKNLADNYTAWQEQSLLSYRFTVQEKCVDSSCTELESEELDLPRYTVVVINGDIELVAPYKAEYTDLQWAMTMDEIFVELQNSLIDQGNELIEFSPGYYYPSKTKYFEITSFTTLAEVAESGFFESKKSWEADNTGNYTMTYISQGLNYDGVFSGLDEEFDVEVVEHELVVRNNEIETFRILLNGQYLADLVGQDIAEERQTFLLQLAVKMDYLYDYFEQSIISSASIDDISSRFDINPETSYIKALYILPIFGEPEPYISNVRITID